MKLKQLLANIADKHNIKNDELNALLGASSLNEIEVSDELNEQFNTALNSTFTIEAALNDSNIKKAYRDKLLPSMKKELLGETPKLLDAIAENFEDSEAILKADSLPEKVTAIKDRMQSLLASKQSDEKSKEALKKYQDTIKELNDQIVNQKSEYENKLSQLEQDFTSKILQKELLSKASKFQLKYDEDVNDMIRKNAIEGLYQKAVPRFDENGELKLFQKDNNDLEWYEENKKVTIDDYLNKSFQKHIKAHENGTTHTNNRTESTATPGNTLEEKRRAMAAETLKMYS